MVVLAAGAGIESADELEAGMGLRLGDLGGAGEVFYVALEQQLEMAVDDERGNFHAAAAVFNVRFGLVRGSFRGDLDLVGRG